MVGKQKIAITGDMHGDGILRMEAIKEAGYSTLIVCGDFGYIWNDVERNNYDLDIINRIGIKILFLDGNHENFDELEKYTYGEMYGGKVQIIRENIIHLLRGEVYLIEGRRVFILGGATSIDKEYRIPGVSWWKQEIPNEAERNNSIKNLKLYDNNVDLILTHTAPTSVLNIMGPVYRNHEFTDFLDKIDETVKFRHWYFGHMHEDKRIDEKHTCLYTDFVDFFGEENDLLCE